MRERAERPVALGLRENLAQFSLLVAVNVFVGSIVGLERAILPLIGRDDFGLESNAAILSFLLAFGAAKASVDLLAGPLSERFGRRRVLIAGWAVALPIAPLIAAAPSWGFVVLANALLGVNQGLAWSMTLNMKVDLVRQRQRGLAVGVNETGGYGGVALAAAASGWLAAEVAPRTVLVVSAAGIAVIALALSTLFVRDTSAHVSQEQAQHPAHGPEAAPSLATSFANGTYRDRGLRACSQAGLVNNLNDGLAWGILPLFLASNGLSAAKIGLVAGLYPAVWAVGQIPAGAWSDRVGRKAPITAGMLIQATALGLLAASGAELHLALAAAVALGAGTALAYPTLIAATADQAIPARRAGAVGVYRFWRDMGYVAGGLTAGISADVVGPATAIAVVGFLTAASGAWVAYELPSGGGVAAGRRGKGCD